MALTMVRVGLASGSEVLRKTLKPALEYQGLKVVIAAPLDETFLTALETARPEVVLVDMDDEYGCDEQALERLLEEFDLPILFEENNRALKENYSFASQKLTALVKKLRHLSGHDSDFVLPRVVMAAKEQPATNVWVLGASMGGPDAVKTFLASLPANIPVAFVLAQHLGDGFVHLLAEQLNRATKLHVMEAKDGHVLHHGEVVVAPVNCRLVLEEKGCIRLLEDTWGGHYHPSIDGVIEAVTPYYQDHTGIIIFTGMGDDGASACRTYHQRGLGPVWAQSAESCAVASMPNAVRDAELVSFSASPQALASKLTARYRA